jgi:MFS transporter, YNFM family, putative membrane transport protein
MAQAVTLPNEWKTAPYSWITLLLFWCALIVVSGAYVTTPLLHVFEAEFQVSKTMSAWTSSSFSFFYAIGFLVFGPLSDRIGRKTVIIIGLLSLAIITPLIGLSTSFWNLVILRGLQGFLASTFAPSALAYTFEVFPTNRLVTTIGFISFGYVTSGIFGQVLADMLYQWVGWQAVFFLFGILYLVTFVAAIHYFPTPAKTGGKEGLRYYVIHSKKIFSERNFVLIYFITITLLLTFMGMYTLLGDFLSNEPFSLNEKQILGIRALGIVGMIVSPFAGKIVNKLGVFVTLRVGIGLSALGLFLVGVGDQILFLIIMSIVYVTGISITFPSIMVLIGELGGEIRALVNTYYAFILFIGAMLGPIIAISLLAIGTYFTTFLLLSLLLVVSFLLSMKIKI